MATNECDETGATSDLDRKEGETLDQYRTRLFDDLGPAPFGYAGDWTKKRDDIVRRIDHESQRERAIKAAAQRKDFAAPPTVRTIPGAEAYRPTSTARAEASALDEAKRQVRRLTDAERQQFLLWVANGMPADPVP
jgi:hypothetical protein